MIDRKAAARYARAFFEDAQDREAVDEAAGDLALLKQIWRQSPDVVSFLAHPLVPLDRKRELCREHLDLAINADQMRFLDLLIERARVDLLPDICDIFQEMVDDHRGIVRAVVQSAAPLTDEEKMRLHNIVAQVFGGKPIVMASVRPDLIGGVTVRVKDAVLDGSVRTSLNMLAADLRAVALDLSAAGETSGD